MADKTLTGAIEELRDLFTWGDPDTFVLISKVASTNEGWMKSTKAMEVGGLGCVIQVTTQQGLNIAEALTYVPGASIYEETNDDGDVISRRIVAASKIEETP